MKSFLKHTKSFIFIFTFTAFLTACGGSSSKKEVYTISANVSTVSFSNEVANASNSSVKVDITFKGDGLLLGFAPGEQAAPWMEYRTENVTSTSATLYIDVVNEELIIPDLYNTKLRLSTGDIANTDLVHHDIDVSLRVWQLTPDTELLSFADTFGVESLASKTFELTSANNTWTASSDAEWLTIEPSSGEGTTTITATPNVSSFSAAGLQQANITFTETTTGDTKILPVELGLDNIYVYADSAAIAFANTGNIKATERTVNILSNNPNNYDWQATTEASWLTLTKLPESDQLKIVANASSLNDDSLTQATIIISALEDDTIISDSIEVNLYNNKQLTENKIIDDLTVNIDAMQTAPALPYIYVGVSNELRTYHQYTGELISTLAIAPEGTLLEQLIIHPKGHLILAKADETVTSEDEDGNPKEEVVTHRYNINLTDLTFTEITDNTLEFEPRQFVRLSNRYFVVSQVFEFADENLQRVFWDQANAFPIRTLDIATSNEVLYVLDGSNSTFKRFTASANDFTTDKISTTLTHEYKPELLGESDAVTTFVTTNDDSGLYLISPTSEWISFDGTTFTDNGLLETNDTIVTLGLTKNQQGRAHYTKLDPTIGFYIDIFADQQITSQVSLSNNVPTDVIISFDDKRAFVNNGNNSSAEIVTLSQFESSADILSFNTTFGDASVAQQELLLTGIGEGWSAVSNVEWLVLGQVITDDENKLTVDIDESKITSWGLLTGTISIYDPASDSYSLITIELAVDAIRLSSNYPALAFNSLATQQTLTHTVDILSNSEGGIMWQASANVDWLMLTPDAENNKLTITADPASAPDNSLTFGQITISATTEGAALSGNIEVSINKQASDASEVTISDIVPNSQAVVVDPLRPYMYVGVGSNINIYDVNTGSLVKSVDSLLPDFDLTNFVMHPNGQLMLLSNSETFNDSDGNDQTRTNHYQLDLASHVLTEIDSANVTIDFLPAAIKMVDGVAIVVTQVQEFADMSLVRQTFALEPALSFNSPFIAVANSTNKVQVLNPSSATIEEFTASYNAYADTTITTTASNSYQNDNFSSLNAFALDSNANNLYSANNALEWSNKSGSDNYVAQGLLHAIDNTASLDVAVDSANNSYFYRFDNVNGFTINKYDNSQSLIWSQPLSTGSAQSYLMLNYQRVISYDSASSSFTILSMP